MLTKKHFVYSQTFFIYSW